MTYFTDLIGRLGKTFGIGGVSTTAPSAADATDVAPAEQPAVPPSTPETTVAPTIGSS